MDCTRVVVLGGGYAGVLAAQRLAGRGRDAVEVTLVSREPAFVERIRVHQRAVGHAPTDASLEALLAETGARFVQGIVRSIDVATRLVHLATGASIAFDRLVYALGSAADRDVAPGAREHACFLGDADDARGLHARLHDARDGSTVVVVGAGLTGIEVATELAEAFPRLRLQVLACDEVGDSLGPSARAYVRKVFARLGVVCHEHARVRAVTASGVELADGRVIEAAMVVPCAGFVVPSLAREAGLAVDARGRIVVDDQLRSVSHPCVHAAGDAAVSQAAHGGEALRMGCVTAMPMAAHCADAVLAEVRGGRASPFAFHYTIQCVSLGRRRGVVQRVGIDDRPGSWILTGLAAAAMKEAICRYTVFALQLERRMPGAYRWPGMHAGALALEAARTA